MKFHNSAQSSLDDPTEWLQMKNQLFQLFFCTTIPAQLTKGKMKAYLLLTIIFTCCFCRYTSVKIKTELKKNILKFGYGINYKYKGMLAHFFDRFCVVTKFILPTINNLKFLTIKYEKCEYLQQKKGYTTDAKQCILCLITYWRKSRPYTVNSAYKKKKNVEIFLCYR